MNAPQRLAALFLLLLAGSTFAWSQESYAQGWVELLHRAADGHSPTPEEIAAAGSPLQQPGADAVRQAVPSIRKALAYPDAQVRAYALTALIGLQVPAPSPEPAPDSGAAKPTAPATTPDSSLEKPAAKSANGKSADEPPPAPPTAFSPQVAAALSVAAPEIGHELTDEATGNRILAATALSGFSSNPPSTAYAPLLAYLLRDDGIGPVGDAVVDDLLLLGPVSDSTAAALIRYLRRTDQTADSRSSLIESIGGHAHQSVAVNAALLGYLNTDDPSVRARLILTLPQLDLSPEVFADTRSRLSVLAANDQENPQVVRAAQAVSSCWTAPRVANCPVN